MMTTLHECAKKLIEIIEQFETEEPITWLKFRFGSSQYWILSKKKPEPADVTGFMIQIEGEIVPGWWLWTY